MFRIENLQHYDTNSHSQMLPMTPVHPIKMERERKEAHAHMYFVSRANDFAK